MIDFLAFFEDMPIWMKLGWVIGVLALFWILEGHYRLAVIKYKKIHHAGINFNFLFFTMLINVGFGALTLGAFFNLNYLDFKS